METLTAKGRAIRVAVTLLVVALALAGSLWGTDDDFPLGPQLQFANADPPNEPVVVLRVEAVDAAGKRFELGERETGIRRAEIEDQVERFKSDPALLRSVGDAYVTRHPGAPRPVEIDLIARSHELHNGSATGHYTDTTLAAWHR
jgi:hypothetical protein